MRDIRYIVPERFRAEDVERMLGHGWLCPFCGAQSTSDKGDADTGWIETPLRQSGTKWICLGCCVDIYSTCLSADFDDHPYRGIVEQAARHESLGVARARRICLEHQRRVIEQRFPDGDYGLYRRVYDRICDLLTLLPDSEGREDGTGPITAG